MTKVLFAIVLMMTTFAVTLSASTKEAMATTMTDQVNSIEVDVLAVMDMCNDSYRIDPTYLQALNESGSFIDETDKTPKCFIRCVFENVGIVSEDEETCPCDRSYKFLRCLMSMEIERYEKS
ncbi:hypothetical protein HF086_013296 [Spodoptera exigua]|uniref:Uncharacterized protein n=1 Tax=Spodoptera exigua TaxID=7107 RepID=A0A922SLA5_SPOEX|nr:hypothetical protein HF086_013296 [Spodoptera exigua]